MGRKRLYTNVTRSAKLRGTQRSPELAFIRSTDFRVPENLIFLALNLN